MGGAVPACLVLFSFFAAGCESTSAIDLTRNLYIYKSPDYRAARRTTEAVFVQRLKDLRPPISQVYTGKGYVEVFHDDNWDRPVPVMVEELLIDEIDRSGIYNGISSGSAGRAKPGDIVIEPTLVSMYRLYEALTDAAFVGRRRGEAQVALRVRVRGPVDATGRRKLLFDEVIQSKVQTKPTLARPNRGIVIAGRAMHKVMKTLMQKLYESNRSAEQATGEPNSGERAGGVPTAGEAGAKRGVSAPSSAAKPVKKRGT